MTNQEIKDTGLLIKNEQQIGGNTALRVGGVIEGIGYALDNKDAANGYYQATINGGSISVNAPNYLLGTSGNLRIKMPAAGTTASTLTIGNANAVQLWYNGAAVSAQNTWEADEIISVFYDGTRFMASNSQGGGGKAEKIKYDNSQSGLSADNVQGALDDIGKWNISQRSNFDFMLYGFNGTKITTLSGYKGFVLKVKAREVYWFDKSITNYSFFVNIPANNSTTSSWHAGILAGTAAIVTDNTANYMYVTVPSSYTEIVVYKREDVQVEIEDVRDNISYSRSLSNFSPYGFNGTKITTLSGYKGFILEVKEGEVYSFDKGLTNYAFFVNIPANNSTASSWHAAIYANTKVVVTDADAGYMYVTVASSVSEIEITKYGNYDIRIASIENYLDAVQDILPTVTPILSFSTYAFNGTKITTLSGYLGFVLEINYGEIYWFDKNVENYAFFTDEPVLNSTPISWHVGIVAGTKAMVTEPDANYMFVTIKNDVDSINVSKGNQYDIDIESLKKVTNKRVMAGSATNIPIIVLIYDDATNNDHLLIEKCDARGLKATLAIPYDISPSYESSLITWLNNGHGIIGHSITPPGMDDSNDSALYDEMEKLLTKINTLGQSCHGFAYYGSTTAEYPHNRRILSKYWDYCWKYHRGKPVNTPSTDVYDLDRGSTDYLNYIDGYKQLILDNLGKNCVIAFGGHMTRTGTGTSQYCTMAYFEQFLDILQWFVDNKLVVSMNAEDAMKEYFKRTNNACIVKASSLYNPVVGQQKMNGNRDEW